MELDIQIKLKENNKMYNLLKKNSYWIKELNRDSNNYKSFINTMKDNYKLRMTDKVTNALDNLDMVSSVLEVLQ